MVKNQSTCAYCREKIFRGTGTYVKINIPHIDKKRILVHKKCEKEVKELLKEKGPGYWSLMYRTGGNPKRLFEEESTTNELIWG